MNAIIPLNISALRVSANDNSEIVSGFSGRQIQFENIPCASNHTSNGNTFFAGDAINRPLDDGNGPLEPLNCGVHLHWELPDYFRKGIQDKEGGAITFPPAPNRWLVIRYFRLYNADKKQYEAASTKGWVVESDYIGNDPTGIPVPLHDANANLYSSDTIPFQYMGRIVDLETWDPTTAREKDYLPSYQEDRGNTAPYYLTAMGFVGPHFSAYYPECATVFGYNDVFDDVSLPGGQQLSDAIANNTNPLKFKVSYQVIGWVHEAGNDPFSDLDIRTLVTKEFNKRKKQYSDEKVAFNQSPADVFVELVGQKMRWAFQQKDLPNGTGNDPEKMVLPERTLCSGLIQEIVWDMPDGGTFFLKTDNANSPDKWPAKVEVGVGNTTTEALAALIKKDLAPTDAAPEILTNLEYLLDALQSGWLNRLEKNNSLLQLEEILHSRGFASVTGGQIWMVKEKDKSNQGTAQPEDLQQTGKEVTLPINLANDLHLLNQAQKQYDQQRSELEARIRQLFMDWIYYINNEEDHAYKDLLSNELKAAQALQKNLGKLSIPAGENEEPLNASKLAEATCLADQVVQLYKKLKGGLPPELILHPVPAPSFRTPAEPVVVIEGDQIEPIARNGNLKTLPCRLSNQLITQIRVNGSLVITSDGLADLPLEKLPPAIAEDVNSLVQEAYLLVPMLADSLKTKIQADNVATILSDLQNAQGGKSPLATTGSNTGLFEYIRAKQYTDKPAPNVTQEAGANSYVFTNPVEKGWPPSPTAWSAQCTYPSFGTNRLDPFSPLFLIWKVAFDPLAWLKSESEFEYGPENLMNFFKMGPDNIDYRELQKKAFTRRTMNPNLPSLTFTGSITLSRNITQSLVRQIESYLDAHPADKAKEKLDELKNKLQSKRILAQSLSGINTHLLQMEKTLKVQIRNLLKQPPPKFIKEKGVTLDFANAATEDTADNWYHTNLNSNQPVGSSSLFNPLRAGYLTIEELTIVDVFGQQMTLWSPEGQQALVPAKTAIASSLTVTGAPDPDGQVFLPPRLNIPTRLWFRWLSATHPNKPGATDEDYVEMNSHPATSPVFGWLMPNHLDNSLFFYQANGEPVGSFGLEHNAQKYRTQPANLPTNPASDLAKDIGKQGQPTINGHLAEFMWFIDSQKNKAGFLADLMKTIEKSHQFINPAQAKENTDLAFLIGRPLALTRAVLGLESQGGVIPVKQSLQDFHTAAQDTVDFKTRQKKHGANIEAVQFPLQLGDLSKTNDGLVGYLIDTPQGYRNETLYSLAADDESQAIQKPAADTIQLTLNGPKTIVTLLMDPRAAIHATPGILPVEQLRIPADQYNPGISKLAMTFFTHPVLGQPATGAGNPQLSIPLPEEKGYEWSWLSLKGAQLQVQPLVPNTATAEAFFSYTPQRLEEGWLDLHKKEHYKTRTMVLFPKSLNVQYGGWPTNKQLEVKWPGLKLRNKDRVSTAAAVFEYYRNTDYWGFPTWQLNKLDEDYEKDSMGTIRVPKDKISGKLVEITDQELIDGYRNAYPQPENSQVDLDDFNTWSTAVFVYYQHKPYSDGKSYISLPTFRKDDQKKTREAILFPLAVGITTKYCYAPLLEAAYRLAYQQSPDVKIDWTHDHYTAGTALAVWAQQFETGYFGGVPTWQSAGDGGTRIPMTAQTYSLLRNKQAEWEKNFGKEDVSKFQQALDKLRIELTQTDKGLS